MQHKLVSVIIPTRNRARYLPLALDSVYAQTYPHFEILLIDDNSTDNTASIAQQYDNRLRYLKQPSQQGVSAARNRGIAEAKGTLVAFLDDDDLFEPCKLEQQVEYMRQHPQTEWLACGFTMVDAQNRPLPNGTILPPHRSITLHNVALFAFMIPSSVMVRTEALRLCGGFPEGIGISEDYHVWAKLAQRADGGVLQTPLTRFRIHSGNTPLPYRKHMQTNMNILDDIFAQPQPSLQDKRVYITNLQKIIADNLARNGDRLSLLRFKIECTLGRWA